MNKTVTIITWNLSYLQTKCFKIQNMAPHEFELMNQRTKNILHDLLWQQNTILCLMVQ